MAFDCDLIAIGHPQGIADDTKGSAHYGKSLTNQKREERISDTLRETVRENHSPRGGLVQGWKSVYCGVVGIPAVDNKNKIQILKYIQKYNSSFLADIDLMLPKVHLVIFDRY